MHCSLASKIQAAITEKTTKAQQSLFLKVKEACGVRVEEGSEEPKQVETKRFRGIQFFRFFTFRCHAALADRDDAIAVNARNADRKLKRVIARLEFTEPSDSNSVIIEQLLAANSAFDKILAFTES
jgi:hypothetical protein